MCIQLSCRDLRAELEVSIDKVIQIAQNESLSRGEESDYTSDTDDVSTMLCEIVTALVIQMI